MSRPVMAQGAAHLPRFGTPLGPWGGTEPGGGPPPPEAKLGSGSVGPSVGEKSRGVGGRPTLLEGRPQEGRGASS